jgi:serine/threonine protein kinase
LFKKILVSIIFCITGLEYLHIACKPALIHRDVKSRNILLASDLVAKIADFGLTKVFGDSKTHITTAPVGTIGYLDPEYVMHGIPFSYTIYLLQHFVHCHCFVRIKGFCVYRLFRYFRTFHITEKSDVYSFGVVLLELITGRLPVVPVSDSMRIHVGEWVQQSLNHGTMENIVDTKMGGDYDINTVLKAVVLALHCKREVSRERPVMTEVVAQLKECLVLENRRYWRRRNLGSNSDGLTCAGEGSTLEVEEELGGEIQAVADGPAMRCSSSDTVHEC